MAEATPTCSKFFLFLVATWFGQLRGGPLRYLGFASSRTAEIYGDLAQKKLRRVATVFRDRFEFEFRLHKRVE